MESRSRTRWSLRAKGGPFDGRVYPLVTGSNVLGRLATLELPFQHDTLSRQNTELLVTELEVAVRDLGSAAGTRINRLLVTGDTPLRAGDELQCGTLRFVLEEEDHDEARKRHLSGVA